MHLELLAKVLCLWGEAAKKAKVHSGIRLLLRSAYPHHGTDAVPASLTPTYWDSLVSKFELSDFLFYQLELFPRQMMENPTKFILKKRWHFFHVTKKLKALSTDGSSLR